MRKAAQSIPVNNGIHSINDCIRDQNKCNRRKREENKLKREVSPGPNGNRLNLMWNYVRVYVFIPLPIPIWASNEFGRDTIFFFLFFFFFGITMATQPSACVRACVYMCKQFVISGFLLAAITSRNHIWFMFSCFYASVLAYRYFIEINCDDLTFHISRIRNQMCLAICVSE